MSIAACCSEGEVGRGLHHSGLPTRSRFPGSGGC